jgi:hypothetical protein
MTDITLSEYAEIIGFTYSKFIAGNEITYLSDLTGETILKTTVDEDTDDQLEEYLGSYLSCAVCDSPKAWEHWRKLSGCPGDESLEEMVERLPAEIMFQIPTPPDAFEWGGVTNWKERVEVMINKSRIVH